MRTRTEDYEWTSKKAKECLWIRFIFEWENLIGDSHLNIKMVFWSICFCQRRNLKELVAEYLGYLPGDFAIIVYCQGLKNEHVPYFPKFYFSFGSICKVVIENFILLSMLEWKFVTWNYVNHQQNFWFFESTIFLLHPFLHGVVLFSKFLLKNGTTFTLKTPLFGE